MPLIKGIEGNYQSSLLFGKPGHGTTTEAIKRITDASIEPSRVIVVGPPSIYSYSGTGYDLFVPTTLNDYVNNFLVPLRSGDLQYDVIVHEKLNAHLSMILDTYPPVHQKDWGTVSNMFFNHIMTEASGRQSYIATVELSPDDEGNFGMALNRFSLVKILPMFSRKAYCYAKPVFDDAGAEIVNITYCVEENQAAALAFIQLPAVNQYGE